MMAPSVVQSVNKDLHLLGLKPVPRGVHQFRLEGTILSNPETGNQFVTLKLHFETVDNKRCRGVPSNDEFQSMLAMYLKNVLGGGVTPKTISIMNFKDVLEYC
jgi:hypothetical protein